MAVQQTHVVRLGDESYELFVSEARRCGVEPDVLADELLRVDLAPTDGDLEQALAGLAESAATKTAPIGLAEMQELASAGLECD